jgi:hypothetical protein
MKTNIYCASRWIALALVSSIALPCLLLYGDTPRTNAQRSNGSKGTLGTAGTGFATAQAAVDALVAAAEKYDEKALEAILGPNSYDIVHSGEPVRDNEMAIEFATQARTKQSLSLSLGNLAL